METAYLALSHLWKRYERKQGLQKALGNLGAVAESVRQFTELEIYKRHQPTRVLLETKVYSQSLTRS